MKYDIYDATKLNTGVLLIEQIKITNRLTDFLLFIIIFLV